LISTVSLPGTMALPLAVSRVSRAEISAPAPVASGPGSESVLAVPYFGAGPLMSPSYE
jgi:hypothetical protein